MALSWKARRRWSVIILVVGLPLYIVVVVSVLNLLGRPGILVEFLVYIGLGLVWILPFKSIFKGIGQPDSDSNRDPDADKKKRGGR